MEKNYNGQEAIQKLKKMAEDVKFCMFATTDSANNLYGRPMTTIKVEDDGTIWFFSSEDTKASAESAEGEKVCLNYADPGKTAFLTVQGTARLIKDKKKMEELWSPVLKAYFPDGLEEPGICLLKVTPEQAHYWDTDAAKVVQLFSLVKAAVTGKTADLGDSGELSL